MTFLYTYWKSSISYAWQKNKKSVWAYIAEDRPMSIMKIYKFKIIMTMKIRYIFSTIYFDLYSV